MKKGVGAVVYLYLLPSPVSSFLFPVDISCKDDVTVLLLLGISFMITIYWKLVLSGSISVS
jgi:hypothetical protein